MYQIEKNKFWLVKKSLSQKKIKNSLSTHKSNG